jgi:type VI secretion system protein ImpM
MTENSPTDGPDDLKDKSSNKVDDAVETDEGPDLLFANIDALMDGTEAPTADPVDLDNCPQASADEPAEPSYPSDMASAETSEETFVPTRDTDNFFEEPDETAALTAEIEAADTDASDIFDDTGELAGASPLPAAEMDDPAPGPDAAIIELGFYGKLPAYGDFIQKRLPQDFINPWHEWLQTGMLACRERDPEGWMAFYLNCPAWCFVLGAGICGEQAVAGVTIPSVDRVGRYFNFTMASILPGDTDPAVFAGARQKWFTNLENLAVSVLEQEMDQDGIERSINERSAELGWGQSPSPAFESAGDHFRIASNDITGVAGFLPALLHQLIANEHGQYGLWWHRGSSQVTAQLVSCANMPVGDTYLKLIMDSELQDVSQSTQQDSEVDYMDELLSE